MKEIGPQVTVSGAGVTVGPQDWGNTPDVDALASFHRSLLLLDVDRYAALAPLAWLAGRQEPDGSWRATWYCGPYHGTRLCLDLFRASDPS
jgi:hypothetical protein